MGGVSWPEPDALAWLAEEACINAWPSPRQLLVSGFLLRAAGGPTRRTNSVNPLRDLSPATRYDPSAVIDGCERIYAALGQPAIFRVPSIAPGMDGPLERRGYTHHAPSVTLFADLDCMPGAADPAVSLDDTPAEDWFAARSQLNRADAQAAAIYRAMTKAILLPKVFAALRVDGTIVAMGYAALDRSLVVIESVGTAEPMRGQGYGRRVVVALMEWGRRRGAAGACLQVVADNEPALALYDALGFGRALSRYHYRRRDRPY